jgi:hypothetical protein
MHYRGDPEIGSVWTSRTGNPRTRLQKRVVSVDRVFFDTFCPKVTWRAPYSTIRHVTPLRQFLADNSLYSDGRGSFPDPVYTADVSLDGLTMTLSAVGGWTVSGGVEEWSTLLGVHGLHRCPMSVHRWWLTDLANEIRQSPSLGTELAVAFTASERPGRLAGAAPCSYPGILSYRDRFTDDVKHRLDQFSKRLQ